MQTFMPLPDFEESLAVLDRLRLGKQRVEAMQIYNALARGPGAGWWAHPAVQMWRYYEPALALYGALACTRWRGMGYNCTLLPWFQRRYEGWAIILPPWLGLRELHRSHRSNLLRKDAHYYGQFGWVEPPYIPYYWPTKEGYTPERPTGWLAPLSSSQSAGGERVSA